MPNFALIFTGAVAVNAALSFRSSDYYKKNFSGKGGDGVAKEDDTASKAEWLKLLKKYLAVYLLATLSDWLQGPYVYALYADYGYSQHDIAVLFVAGFGSSMIFGSFVGGMADWGGRRAFVLIFSLVYAASCLTKHFKNYWILMLGRLLGGVATSLLFSVFDAWLIRSHSNLQLKQYLGKSFSWAAYGNSIIAIVAGLLANKAASLSTMTNVANGFYLGGFLAPFDIALVALLTCGFFALTTWEENYGEDSGDSGRKSNWHDGLRNAFLTTIRSQDILLCGIISSLFEGSMYVFVFMWTPALTEYGEDALPFGLIFSTFMVCCMAGSSMYNIQSDRWKNEQLGVALFATAALAMAMIALFTSRTLKFLGMNLFEITVGMYWPIMGTMKGIIVPESKRAAIYNLYRIPLNFIVLFSLLTDLTPKQSFTLNFVMLSTAACLQLVLMKRRELTGMTTTNGNNINDKEEEAPLTAKVEAV